MATSPTASFDPHCCIAASLVPGPRAGRESAYGSYNCGPVRYSRKPYILFTESIYICIWLRQSLIM